MSHAFHDLLQRARRGDTSAMDQLLAGHAEPLRAFVRLKSRKVVRDRESCSDLVQSVFREVLVDLDAVDFRDEASFRNWLFTVALHKILHRVEYLTARKRDPAREVPLESNLATRDVLRMYGRFCTPSQQAGAAEEVARIEAAFDRLSDDDRELILSARLAGRTTREIAAARGTSEEAVRKALSRARARLGILLG